MKKRFWIFSLIVVVLIAGGVAYKVVASNRSATSTTVQTATVTRGTVTTTTTGAGTVRSGQNATVTWGTSGKVGTVSVKLGQQVKAGDELATLESGSLDTDIIQAQVDLIDAQTALEELQKPQPLKIAQAQAALETAKAALDDLLNPSATAISEAQAAVIDAQDAVETAQKHIVKSNYARATKETIAAAQASYVVAKAEVERLQKEYKKIKGDPSKDAAKALALTRLEAAKTKAYQALATLNWLQTKYTQDEIDTKNNNLALAEAQLADAQEALEKLQNPSPEDIALAQAIVDDAQETLDTAKSGATADELTIAQTRVTLAEAELAKATLTAPFDGMITDVKVLVGDLVSTGGTAFKIDDSSRLYVDLQISEVDISQIKLDQDATLTFDAIADKEYHGKVTNIGLVGTVSSGVVNYTVTVQITDGDASILSGMTAAVSIVVDQHENVLVVPNQALHTSGGQRTVTVLFEGQQITVPVTVGLAGDSLTEVTSTSLKEGDEVVVTGSPSSSSTSTNSNTGGSPGDAGGPPGGFFGP